jgi:hypothetical protein
MNFNELSQNSNVETKEDVIENLETAALKIKAENRIEELEKKSKEVIGILEKFSEKIPTMIDRLENINEGLKLENFNKILESINNNSKEICKISKIINENSKGYGEKITNTARKEISLISEKSREIIDKHKYFSSLVNKGILFAIIIIFITNITMIFFYKRQLNIATTEIDGIHQILMENKKYWIDENNYDIFIRNNRDKK